MIDEIFEMIMKEARSRPGDNLQIKAFLVMLELLDRIFKAYNIELKSFLVSPHKSDKAP